jgi:hypothetical protein
MRVGGLFNDAASYQDHVASDGRVTDEWLVAKDSEEIIVTE